MKPSVLFRMTGVWTAPLPAAVLLLFSAIPAFTETNAISLAAAAPPDALQRILLPVDQWRPFPKLPDRAGWNALPGPVRAQLIRDGEEVRDEPIPPLPATLYLQYKRVGNRSRFEAQHRARRERLHALVLAECAEAKGRFLDPIADLVWAICEESSWVYPAHIAAQRAGVGLPDVTEPIVDLFSAETGVSLSWTLYLLGPALDKVSPRLRPRLAYEIERRILTPILERDDFGWMGFHEAPGHRPNNWNPWINASVLTSTLVVETNAARRVALVEKTLRSLDNFLQPYPGDGSCDEGPGYWGHAAGSLLDCLDLLSSATGGKLNFFDRPLIQNMGRFIERAQICGDWFVPVGDCSARLDFDRALVFRYGKGISDPSLRAMAAFGATPENVMDAAGRYFGRQLFALFNLEQITSLHPSSPPLPRDVWLGSEDMQLLTARKEAGRCDGFFVAAWGGHNAQSHNHNDVGNFVIFADGEPVLVDVGAPTYTAQTFSGRRYELWPMQSAYHNLPTINGVMQSAGRRFAARAVQHQADETAAELSLDIAPAYPESAHVKAWRRTVRLNRGKDVEITDAFELSESSGATSLNLMTPMQADVKRPGLLRLTRGGKSANGHAVEIEYDPSRLSAAIEPIHLDDKRLMNVWGETLNRIVLRATAETLKGHWAVTVRTE